MIEIGFLDFLFKKDYEDITYQETVEMLKDKNKYQFVDMRTKMEYKRGHAKGFNKNIDYYVAKSTPSMFERISKDKPVILMCATGIRSKDTSKRLCNMGYTNVYNYKHGLRAWSGSIVK